MGHSVRKSLKGNKNVGGFSMLSERDGGFKA